MLINERLKEIRQNCKLTRKEVAEYIGVDQSTYGKYELGLRKPSIEILGKIAKLYSTSVEYLLCLTNDPDKQSRLSGHGDFIVRNGKVIEYGDLPEDDQKALESYFQHLRQKNNL